MYTYTVFFCPGSLYKHHAAQRRIFNNIYNNILAARWSSAAEPRNGVELMGVFVVMSCCYVCVV